MVVERALQVVAAAVGRTHRAKREAARVVDIDQFMRDRRRLRQNTEPAERIDPFKRLDRRRFYAGAADAVKAVAAGDEVAGDLVADAVLVVGDARTVGVEIMRLDVGGLIDGGEAGGIARVHQVERDLGLAVDRHRLAGRRMQVDAMTRPAEGELDAVMHQPFAMGARACANLIEHRNGAFLEQAGSDAAKHILARLAFENDVVDAVTVQQLAEQQSRRPRANDCDFCPQYLLSRFAYSPRVVIADLQCQLYHITIFTKAVGAKQCSPRHRAARTRRIGMPSEDKTRGGMSGLKTRANYITC